jgi:crossover junction endodeoxyribonuclease RuvC
VRIFGIDPGSRRTGYGCVESDGRRHHLVTCGTIASPATDSLPQRLMRIHRELVALIALCRPDVVTVENLFHGVNARSALTLGHARGVAILAAVQAGCELVEYTPAEVKRAVVGYGRAEKPQVQRMIKLLLGLDRAPSPHDAADALAIAICHLHSTPRRAWGPAGAGIGDRGTGIPGRKAALDPASPAAAPRVVRARSWRQYRPPSAG